MPVTLEEQLRRSLGATWTVERELDADGMFRVVLAEDARTHERVVFKVLSPGPSVTVRAELFERDIASAVRLRGPHVIPVTAAGVVDGLPWYSEPQIQGETLRARVERGVVPQWEAARILRDAARAMADAHAFGIVHLDIRPEKIVLSGGGAAIRGFGIAGALARSLGEHREPEGRVDFSAGTPGYMAPEQSAGNGIADHRSDIYTWGVVAYEVVGGEHPSSRVLHPRLAALIMRCMEKSPDRRPPSAAELVTVLDGCQWVATAARQVSSD